MASSSIAALPATTLAPCARWSTRNLKTAFHGLPELLKPCHCVRRPRCMPTADKGSYEEPPLGRRDALFVGVAGAAMSARVGAAVMLQPVDMAQAYLGGGPYGRQVTRGQDLSGQDFSNLDLTRQDFKTSILRQTNFKNSKLAGARFFDAHLAGADFSNTDLRGADFSLCRATQGSSGSHHPKFADCSTAVTFGSSARKLHHVARTLRAGASPHHAGSNLVIGPEPILKEGAPARADSSSWTPDEEWNDMLQPRQGRLLLVDGMAVAYRAYFKIGAKLMWNETRHASQEYPEAEEILTTLTFVSNLVTLLNLVPTHVGVVFDAGGKNFRHELFPQYKQHRAAMPDTLANAMTFIKSSVQGLGLTIIERHGVEADDVIASLATRGVKAGMEVRVASPDKDFFQILGPNLRLLRPRPKGIGIDSFGLEQFEAKFGGLRVDQFADMQALMGDQADNIPGVFGIGPKTACKLLKQYGTLDGIMASRASVMPLRVRNALCNEYELLPSFKKLVLLRTELDDLHTGHVEAMEFAVPRDTEAATNFLDALAANVQSGEVEARSIKHRIEQIWNALEMRRRARISR